MSNQHAILSPIQSFQLFCLEGYRNALGITGKQALHIFKKAKVFDYLASGYEVLHTQSKHYIISELDIYIKHRNGTIPRKHSRGQTTHNS
jgi:hypothetical protein